MKRIGRVIVVTMMTASMVVMPVLATPSVSELESGKAAAESEAQSLQAELTELLDKIGQLEEKLVSTGEEIIQAEADLVEAEAAEKEQYEAMKLRIKYMYENGETSELETLVSAKSFSDLLNKAAYVSEVHSYDREKMAEYVETKEKIRDLKNTLEEQQASLKAMQAEYEVQEASLISTLDNKRAEIADFDEQLQAAAEAAALAAQQRQEAAANQNNNNSGNSNSGSTNAGNSNAGNTNTGNTNSGNTNTNTGTDQGTSSGNASAAQTIINAAYGQLGVPYVYGGSTPGSGLDCSGLVQYCHRVAGISLPRTSQAQGGCGIAVSDPQPGDIVCYGSHVGIYLGGGQMIHAPKPGDVVKVAAVYGSPWYRRCW